MTSALSVIGTAGLDHGRAYVPFAASARFNAHRFFVAAMIAFLPAAESFRFGLETTLGVAPADAALEAAHLFRCASAIAFLPAALIFRRLRFGGSGAAVDSAGPPVSNARSSAIWSSMRVFCASKPSMAAVMISVVSFGVGMWCRSHSGTNCNSEPKFRRGR
jgi:hypothetical protein